MRKTEGAERMGFGLAYPVLSRGERRKDKQLKHALSSHSEEARHKKSATVELSYGA
jgi:hypothetical protein